MSESSIVAPYEKQTSNYRNQTKLCKKLNVPINIYKVVLKGIPKDERENIVSEEV